MDHRDDSQWILLEQVSLLAEFSLLGRSVSRKEFQETESDILQQALSTMHDPFICDHIMIPSSPWDFPNGDHLGKERHGLLDLASSYQPQ